MTCSVHKSFMITVKKKNRQNFSGVGVHHQNEMAEQSIQTIMLMAWTYMINVGLRWNEWGIDSLALWPIVVWHSAWMYNCVPNRISGLEH